MDQPRLPRYNELMLPVLEALKGLSGSALRNEIVTVVTSTQNFSDEQLDVRYETTGAPILADRIGWALSYLKKLGAVENSARGVWALTTSGRSIETEEQIDQRLKALRPEQTKAARIRREIRESGARDSDLNLDDDLDSDDDQWQALLLQRLLQMSPDAFERLTQRLLREAGFRDVEVLGKSGDGGIDGVGVYRLSLVSFPIYFQCKRFKGSVPASTVRDFRGAMVGRGEKGLLVTTGTFTSGARKESSRDGAPPVELIDGDELCDLLKVFDLGVRTQVRQVEDIDLDLDFFKQFEEV
ncbi:MAG: restriction endonuclease [Acidimicrobiaceae bacterium]|nr:restriction endonuclease [Acidimicrobiia bacterium]MCY4493374.1 restriction endonuclease [Acidimicrobiaceae bacterium]